MSFDESGSLPIFLAHRTPDFVADTIVQGELPIHPPLVLREAESPPHTGKELFLGPRAAKELGPASHVIRERAREELIGKSRGDVVALIGEAAQKAEIRVAQHIQPRQARSRTSNPRRM